MCTFFFFFFFMVLLNVVKAYREAWCLILYCEGPQFNHWQLAWPPPAIPVPGCSHWKQKTSISISQHLALYLSRTESMTSHIQRIPSPSSSKAAPKLKYSHVVGSTPRPRDPGKLSPDLSHVQSRDILTTLGSHDIQAHDPGKVSHDLPRDWSSTRSQVAIRSPDQACFRHTSSLLIGM